MIKKYLKRWQTKKSIYTVNLSNRLIKNKNTEEFDKIMKTYNILKFHLVYLKEKDEKIHIYIQHRLQETKRLGYSLFKLLNKKYLCPEISTLVGSLIKKSKNENRRNL